MAEKNVKNSRKKTSRMIEKTSKLAEKNVNGLYRNSVISAILGAETAEKWLKTAQNTWNTLN